ncbi:hypothetical protein [Haliangium ochraceum]|uniref:Lipase class 3 n=1 Tax=Haliangium ochraceum (strain DSM 14365 / JCM 11303 / SMP-2) TaxID=502025 RepID=D0LWZ0_HALO1|nr:hypothetical protein [Haliangium ochraceum]ACY14237.1 hypothetical protein Hoch_1687 [Haliangium ochraceum DSM 14365]
MSYEDHKQPQSQRNNELQSAHAIQRAPAPGKRTRTMSMPQAGAARAPVQRKASPGAASAGADSASTARWMNTAMRPDLHPMPVQRKAAPGGAVVQRKSEPSGQGGGSTHIPTREEVHANPAAFGIPEGGNPDDFFNEYVAHTLAYMQPEQLDVNALDPNADDYQSRVATIERHRATMRGWGYDPDSLTFLNDSRSGDNETGLQAVRIDPLDPEGEHGSIVGFRGTEPVAGHQSTLTNPTGFADDVATDLGRDIGGNQYRENQERIHALIAGGTGPMTLTGHSLGGALAQHAAAGSTDLNVSNVVGFQAPGIDSSAANSFNAANADGHIDVRFHEHEKDVVHRAGEQKLDGTHYTWHDTNDPSFLGAHLTNFMYNGVNGDGEQVTNVGAGSSPAVTEHDPITNRQGWEGGRRILGGGLNVVASPFQGAFALGQGLGNAAVNAGQGVLDSGSSLVGGISEGASQMGNGEVLSGLGTMAGGVWDGTTGLLGTGANLVGDVAGAAVSGVTKAGSELVEGVGTVAHGIGNLATWGAQGIGRLFSGD